MKKPFTRFHIFLSHHPFLYAVIVGIAIVLFWRGVWHSVDLLHMLINHYSSKTTLDIAAHPWWDGPLSFIVGCSLLMMSRAFISSFIGNELILSGLRSERRLTQTAESEIKSEADTIADIKDELTSLGHKIDELETQVERHNEISRK